MRSSLPFYFVSRQVEQQQVPQTVTICLQPCMIGQPTCFGLQLRMVTSATTFGSVRHVKGYVICWHVEGCPETHATCLLSSCLVHATRVAVCVVGPDCRPTLGGCTAICVADGKLTPAGEVALISLVLDIHNMLARQCLLCSLSSLA